MNAQYMNIFVDETRELTDFQAPSPNIDFTDVTCPGTPSSGTCGALTSSGNFLVTAPTPTSGLAELEFMMANTFWNCPFSYKGIMASTCGVQIRQGIAHMIDKNVFCTESFVAAKCTPLDNPEPIIESNTANGLLTPNPCLWDSSFPESGRECKVGGSGGTSYHLAAASGASIFPWLPAPGSPDLNAAARHFVNAGVASGYNVATSVLTNPVSGTKPTFFIRNDNTALKQFGESLAEQICYLFTGSYSIPCAYLDWVEGDITAFNGINTSISSVNLSWWMYTAGIGGLGTGGDLNEQFPRPGVVRDPFDSTLYFQFNSRFISGISSIQQPAGPCSSESVPTYAANNYMYLCNSSYDGISAQMETSSCLSAQGDPAIGASSNFPTSPGNGLCSDGHLSAISAGIQAEDIFGQNVFAIPMYGLTNQFGYLNNGWNNGVINSADGGIPNHFTWLNAYNPNPPSQGAIRVGLSQTTHSVNPYVASTAWDLMIVGNIYDSLFAANPLNPSQIFNWMTYGYIEENNATVISQGGYTPPPHTLTTYHFTLRNDVYFQDGRPVTAYDVAFSYLSMVGSGAFLGAGASTMTGITILGPRTFDISVRSLGAFVVLYLTGIPVVSGFDWSNAGPEAWKTAIAACTASAPCPKAQYALNGATVFCPSASGQPGCASPSPSSLIMKFDPTKVAATYDPQDSINEKLVGSGPWECKSSTGVVGASCSSSGTQNPPPGGAYTLTRFGNGLPPASSTSGIYFRSSGNLALYIWTQENDANPLQPVSAVSLCFGQPVSNGSCTHWQHGIGASATGVVGINQVSAVELRYNLNWISPFEWASSPPLGIAALPPVLYEGSVTLNPCNIQPTTGYDC